MKQVSSARLTPSLRKLFSPVRLLLLDVDGVLTDGTLYLGEDFEAKGFSIYDGHGIVLARRAGIEVGFISGRKSKATRARAKELGVRLVFQTTQSKADVVKQIKRQRKLAPQNVCYVGDDVIDLPAMREVGAPVAVANAMDEVKAIAKYVTRRRGGEGAVREVIEHILKSQDLWRVALGRYLKD